MLFVSVAKKTLYFGDESVFWMGFMEIIHLSVVFPLILVVEQESYCLNAAGSSVHFLPFFLEKYLSYGWSLI